MGEIKNIPVISDEKVDINRAAISHRAVSYTHLDVYKRQPLS